MLPLHPQLCPQLRCWGSRAPRGCSGTLQRKPPFMPRVLNQLQPAVLPPAFASEAAKVAYDSPHGESSPLAAEEWERQTPACASFQAFTQELCQVSTRRSSRDAATSELLTLRQGRWSIMDFAIDFQIVARHSGWPPPGFSPTPSLHELADDI